jgi:hypothetical protein
MMAGQSVSLRELQRGHDCTDCGFSYLDEPDVEGADFLRQVIGGGTVVRSTREPITELHILPHCGTELPADLVSEIDESDLPVLSRLVHQNADIGTGAMYRVLADRVMSGLAPGVAVAGFHLSRLMLDSNRAAPQDQMPARPYVGSADIYADYLRRHRADMREYSLLPWLAATNGILREMDDRAVVYHHHTYDVLSMSPRSYDLGASRERPAFQLTWRKPAMDELAGELSEVEGLAPLEDVEDIRDRIWKFLEVEAGVQNGQGDIDYPLNLPVTPFLGTRQGDPAGGPCHVLYDLRKKILTTDELIHAWVQTAPWKLPNR